MEIYEFFCASLGLLYLALALLDLFVFAIHINSKSQGIRRVHDGMILSFREYSVLMIDTGLFVPDILILDLTENADRGIKVTGDDVARFLERRFRRPSSLIAG